MKFKYVEAKQYSKEKPKDESLPPRPMKGRASPKAPMSSYKYSSDIKNSFGSNKYSHTVGDENLDYTLECMQRQDRIMGNHKRAEIMDSTEEDLADEFDGIDEMKVRGIDRTVMATKKINKPTNKASFMPSSSKSSLIEGKLSSSRNLYPGSSKSSVYQNDRTHDNMHHSISKHSRQPSKFKRQLGNGTVEQLIFCISNDHDAGAFYFQAQVDDIHKKIKKVVQIGFLEVQTDTNALSHV